MYISEILWFLTWPALIFATYFLSRWALRKFESKLDKE